MHAAILQYVDDLIFTKLASSQLHHLNLFSQSSLKSSFKRQGPSGVPPQALTPDPQLLMPHQDECVIPCRSQLRAIFGAEGTECFCLRRLSPESPDSAHFLFFFFFLLLRALCARMCTHRHCLPLSPVSHSLLVDLGRVWPLAYTCGDKCKSRPCTGCLVCVSLELTIYSCSLLLFFFFLSASDVSGSKFWLCFLAKNAFVSFSQDKSLFFLSRKSAPLVFEVKPHPRQSNTSSINKGFCLPQ